MSTHLIFSHLMDFDKKKNTLSKLNSVSREDMMLKGITNMSKLNFAVNESQLMDSRSHSRAGSSRAADLYFLGADFRSR